MKRIFINVAPWQTRLAVVRDGILQNIYFESSSTNTLERCFFKGEIIKVLPGIQTAFVDIGQERSGFLHISEIDRELAVKRMYGIDEMEEAEDLDNASPPQNNTRIRQQLDIGKILKEKEFILVQIGKEPLGDKGAKLTTCFTLPGRFIVLMPNIPRIGISKKIDDKDERQRLKELVARHLPEGMGGIIRTTSLHKNEEEIVQDILYLAHLWEDINVKFNASTKKGEKLHMDLPLSLQIIRDHLDKDVEFVVCDDKIIHSQIYKFVKTIAPEYAQQIRLYNDKTPLFEAYNIEQQIYAALKRKLPLKSGGMVIVEHTEAMTVFDVNTGKYVGTTNSEDTIVATNIEAAEVIVSYLLLANVGGLVVIDFIDMEIFENRQKLSRIFEKLLRERDKLQSVILQISAFGLMQLTRKRTGKTLRDQFMVTCSTCSGAGVCFSIKTEAHMILRNLQKIITSNQQKSTGEISVTLHMSVLNYMTTMEYESILFLEKKGNCKIILLSHDQCNAGAYSIDF